MHEHKIAIIPEDGIGKEVVPEAYGYLMLWGNVSESGSSGKVSHGAASIMHRQGI